MRLVWKSDILLRSQLNGLLQWLFNVLLQQYVGLSKWMCVQLCFVRGGRRDSMKLND